MPANGVLVHRQDIDKCRAALGTRTAADQASLEAAYTRTDDWTRQAMARCVRTAATIAWAARGTAAAPQRLPVLVSIDNSHYAAVVLQVQASASGPAVAVAVLDGLDPAASWRTIEDDVKWLLERLARVRIAAVDYVGERQQVRPTSTTCMVDRARPWLTDWRSPQGRRLGGCLENGHASAAPSIVGRWRRCTCWQRVSWANPWRKSVHGRRTR